MTTHRRRPALRRPPHKHQHWALTQVLRLQTRRNLAQRRQRRQLRQLRQRRQRPGRRGRRDGRTRYSARSATAAGARSARRTARARRTSSPPSAWSSTPWCSGTPGYLDAAMAQLRAEGHDIEDEDVARISSLRDRHINFLGRYLFNIIASGPARACVPSATRTRPRTVTRSNSPRQPRPGPVTCAVIPRPWSVASRWR